MLKKIIILILICGIYILTNCSSFRNFFPLEFMYYPVFGNGYEKDMIISIKYTDGHVISGKIPSKITSRERYSGYKYESITIFDLNNILIADYPKEYLDFERQNNSYPENEFWVAYEDGLILLPEEYHGTKWKKYIENLKKR